MKSRLFILILTLWTAFAFSQDFDYFFEKAEQKSSEKDYISSIYYYQRALQVNPNSHTTHNNYGNALTYLGRFEEAIKQYRRAIFLKYDYSTAYSNLGLVFLHKSLFEKALSNFEKAIEIDSTNHVAYYYLGRYFVAQKLYEESLEPFLTAIALKDDEAIYYYETAVTYFNLNEDNLSKIYFQKAKSIDPSYSNTYIFLGNLALREGDREQAVENYQIAASLGDVNAQTWLETRDIKWKKLKVKKRPFWMFWKKSDSDIQEVKKKKKPFWMFWKKVQQDQEVVIPANE